MESASEGCTALFDYVSFLGTSKDVESLPMLFLGKLTSLNVRNTSGGCSGSGRTRLNAFQSLDVVDRAMDYAVFTVEIVPYDFMSSGDGSQDERVLLRKVDKHSHALPVIVDQRSVYHIEPQSDVLPSGDVQFFLPYSDIICACATRSSQRLVKPTQFTCPERLYSPPRG
jgi:hypothetical protein